MSEKDLKIAIVGQGQVGKTALIEELREKGVEVVLVDTEKEITFPFRRIKEPDPIIEPLRTLYTPDISKPKHHNGKYNKINRNKNKASRKARKQNRRK